MAFEVGDLVWAKMKGYPPWPARIEEPPANSSTPSKIKHHYYVYFFGSKNYGWIPKADITVHSSNMVQAANSKKKTKQMQSAINEIMQLSEKQHKKAKDSFVALEDVASTSKELFPKRKRTAGAKYGSGKTKKGSKEHFGKVHSCTEGSSSSDEHMGDLDNKSDQSNSTDANCSLRSSFAHPSPSPTVDNGSKRSSVLCDAYTDFLQKFKEEGVTDPRLEYFLEQNPPPVWPNPPIYVERPAQRLDVLTPCDFVMQKKIVPTDKKIGFIGLGVIGQGIAKSLLSTGHSVIVWDHNAENCAPFLAAGVQSASTPAELVLASDIVMSCLKDQEDVKHVVFSADGVIKGFDRCTEPNKIYVEMTLIDEETSKNLFEAFHVRNAKFLEASFYGSKKMAENGKLNLRVAGDPDAYEDCVSCFKAMSESTQYTDMRLGNTCNITFHMLEGCISACIAEVMNVAKKATSYQHDFLKLLKFSPYISQLVQGTGNRIDAQDYSPRVSINRALNAMRLAGQMRQTDMSPSFVANAVVGLYARAAQMDYGSHDMSATYLQYDIPRPREVRPEPNSTQQDVQQEPNSTQQDVQQELNSTQQDVQQEPNSTQQDVQQEPNSTQQDVQQEPNSTQQDVQQEPNSDQQEEQPEPNSAQQEEQPEPNSTQQEVQPEPNSTQTEVQPEPNIT